MMQAKRVEALKHFEAALVDRLAEKTDLSASERLHASMLATQVAHETLAIAGLLEGEAKPDSVPLSFGLFLRDGW